MNTTLFVHMLPEQAQKEIRSKLVLFFLSQNQSLLEVKQNTRLGLEGRICDLEDTIEIAWLEKYFS